MSGVYTLRFTRKNRLQQVVRELEVSAASLGEAMRVGARIAEDSHDKWQFEKAERLVQ